MTLSFIIPTKNEEKILAQMLQSVRKLTAVPYEIIVSDGQSTDKTLEIARHYADKVVAYTGAVHQTIAMARNAGAAQAEGKYIVFMDADVFIPDMNFFFTKAIEQFEKDEKLVALMPQIRVTPETERLADRVVLWSFSMLHYLFNNVLHIGNGFGEFQMVHKDAFRQIGGYNEHIVASEDMDIMIRLSKVGKTRMLRSITAYHTGRRIHKVGWWKLLPLWFINGVHVMLFQRSASTVWKEVR